MSFVVTDAGDFGYLSSRSLYSQKCHKTSKNAAKVGCSSSFEDTKTHKAN